MSEKELNRTFPPAGVNTPGAMPVRQFLTALVPVVSREPGIFFAAVDAVCALEESPFPGGRQLIVLKKPKVLGMLYLSAVPF